MKYKSVLGAFLFILLASFVALIVFIQTRSFGRLVTKVVSDVSERRLATEVKVSSFTLSLFPPGFELNKVSVKKQISPLEAFEAEIGKIGFYISLIEVEEKRLTFGEIRMADSNIKYTFPQKDEELKEIDPNLIKRIFDLPDRFPVRIDTVLIENTRIVANHELVEARRLKLFKKDSSYIARFHLSNLRPSVKSSFKLDEIWGDVEASQEDITLYRVKVQHDVQSLLLKGKIRNFPKLKGSELDIIGESQLHLRNVKQYFPVPEAIKINDGNAKATFALSYKDGQTSAKGDVLVEDLKSNLLYASELRANWNFEDQKVFVNTLSMVHKDEKIELLAPVQVFDLENKALLTRPIKASVKDLSLNNVLRFLGPKLRPLKGKLSGELGLEYKKGNIRFLPKDGFVVQNLGLVVGESKFTILMVKKALLRNSEFAVVDGEFQMRSSVELAKSRFEVEGLINKNNIRFNVPSSPIDLEDFGNISKLDIKGAGNLAVSVSGPPRSTVINISGNTKGFEVLGYKLGDTDKNITIDLDNSTVIIGKMESRLGKTHLSGNGTVNYGDRDIALGISSNDAGYSDLVLILQPIFKNLTFLPNDLDFKSKIDVDIFGKYRLEDMKIRSKVNLAEIFAYGESFNSASLDISLFNKVLAFKNFSAEKGAGHVHGDFVFGLDDKRLNLKYQWENLQLSSFNITKKLGLNVDSTVSGKIAGEGSVSNYVLKLESTAFNTKAGAYNFEDSFVAMEILPSRVIGKANLLGKTLDSTFNLALKRGMASQLKFKFKSDDLKPFLVALLGQHLETEAFTGRLNFEYQTTFQDGFNNLDLTANLRELTFSHPDFHVNYTSDSPEFIVRDSVINKWSLSIKEPDLYLTTNGEGVFGKKVSLVQESHLNSKILEVLLAPVLSSEGFIRNIVRIDGDGTEFDFSVSSKTDRIDLSIERVPAQISNLKYDLEYSANRLTVQHLTSSLDGGSVSLKGDVFFDNNQPDVNLKFVFDKAEIPVLGKSAVNLSGEGIILGNNYPYSIGGEITVNKAQIVNELNEFSSKSAGFSQIRFLPKNQESALGKMFTLNLNVKAENPIRITNSLMDVALVGEVRLSGNPSRPRGEGRLTAPVNSSRIFFKNNEYVITSADINFTPKKEISNPDFDIQALTIISSYRVYPKAYGDLERFNFDLTSDPALPRNSILSLIAFGYTDEIQSTLYAKDQQSLTEVGVGSFVFDRFKISDILNKQFGLQVNLGTVIEQSTTDSLLTGRSQDSGAQGPLGRTRSATKIELRKRLDEALTLSVSSTMGGSIGQRQSMNLNYGISKNVQLEGVYELRTNEEGEADIIYNSIGGDIKFRRTFK